MKIALLTSAEYENLSDDDRDLVARLLEQGVSSEPVIWDRFLQRKAEFDGAVFRSTWDYCGRLEEFQRFLQDLKSSSIKVFNSTSTIQWNLNKNYLKTYQDSGTKLLRSIFPSEVPSLSPKDLVKRLGQKVVAKPIVGASASEIEVFNLENSNELEAAWALLRSERFILQEFFSEISSAGELSLVFFGNEFSHAVQKFPRSGDFRVQEKFGGQTLPFSPEPGVIEQAQEILRRTPDKLLYARVDGLWNGREFTLMELELFEPSFYFVTNPHAVTRFARAIKTYFTASI